MAAALPEKSLLTAFVQSREYAGQIGARLSEARDWMCISSSEVFHKLGFKPSWLNKVEAGVILPSIPELVKLALLYECSLDWLLGISDTPDIRCAIAGASGLSPVENAGEIATAVETEKKPPAAPDYKPRTPEGRRSMCTSKVRFPSETKAIRGAIGASSGFGHPLRPYRCPICRGWHLTSRTDISSRAS